MRCQFPTSTSINLRLASREHSPLSHSSFGDCGAHDCWVNRTSRDNDEYSKPTLSLPDVLVRCAENEWTPQAFDPLGCFTTPSQALATLPLTSEHPLHPVSNNNNLMQGLLTNLLRRGNRCVHLTSKSLKTNPSPHGKTGTDSPGGLGKSPTSTGSSGLRRSLVCTDLSFGKGLGNL